ncbi:pilus assembly PilX N-terminal domain-containing protein [Candidatus Margulisiibacteriota bacterium]
MNKNKKGFVLPFVLILITVLVVIVGSVTYLTTVGVQSAGSKLERHKALNIAEAGFNKAIWYLVTHPEEGGEGAEWRTSSLTEDFGEGSYTIAVVTDPIDPDAFSINSKGYYRDAIAELEVFATIEYADRFIDYALHSETDIDIDPDSAISGDIFADGDVTVEAGASVTDGTVQVTAGHSVSGEGEYVLGATAAPETPVIDYAYYENKFAIAEAGGPDVVQGDQVYSDLDLNEQTLYVNGTVTVEGHLSGKGDIVATGQLFVRDYATIGNRTKLIARGKIVVYDDAVLKKNVMFYSDTRIRFQSDLEGNRMITALTPKKLVFADNVELKGIFFGGKIKVGSNVKITGSLIGGKEEDALEIGEGVTLKYKNYTKKIPPGFATTIRIIKWTKK